MLKPIALQSYIKIYCTVNDRETVVTLITNELPGKLKLVDRYPFRVCAEGHPRSSKFLTLRFDKISIVVIRSAIILALLVPLLKMSLLVTSSCDCPLACGKPGSVDRNLLHCTERGI